MPGGVGGRREQSRFLMLIRAVWKSVSIHKYKGVNFKTRN